ncbi:MAG: hypothetical protein E6J34_22110 [Chloroflexi bacterium]|nr:MAG: hypothetical protein E6J34_22110 [Chloroflexota bacterium]
MYVVTRDLVEAYAALFVHCWDYYAVQQPDGSYRPCYERLSLSRLVYHGHGVEELVELVGLLSQQGVSCVAEASRRGWHVWVHVEPDSMASHVRAWLLPYARRFGVELYPAQDTVGKVGSLIRLPLGVHRKSGGWYPFLRVSADGLLVPVGQTVAECCAWAGENVSRSFVPQCCEPEFELVSRVRPVSVQRGQHSVGLIREWCEAQDVMEVIGCYTHLDHRGIGRCPLPGHHTRGDARSSLQVFPDRARDRAHWYCYTWKRAGDVFDFLRFYHGLSMREAWERLQEGMLY